MGGAVEPVEVEEVVEAVEVVVVEAVEAVVANSELSKHDLGNESKHGMERWAQAV